MAHAGLLLGRRAMAHRFEVEWGKHFRKRDEWVQRPEG